MSHILNILITSKNSDTEIIQTELYPLAFKTIDEIDYELECEGYIKYHDEGARINTKYVWSEENLTKTATIKYTSIASEVE